ncbi:hypothetical protein RND71_007626 [Anisodus tanguticus]|uniref:Uncharacterized protein n=1 Tax=Anisodus tanguticus TaxID=243964 RepID=A0AAE1SN25_9SOLA|nr:hypothetical protein RND71_007626 [Anisodus tanguticus]
MLRDGWQNCEEKTCLNLLLGHTRGNTRMDMYGKTYWMKISLLQFRTMNTSLKDLKFHPSPLLKANVSCGEKGVITTMQKEQTKQEDHNQDLKIPSEIEEESQNIASETSTLTTNSPKIQEEEQKVNNFDNNSTSFSSNSSSSASSFGSMKTKKKIDDHVKENGEKNSTQSMEKTSKNPRFNKSRSNSKGASSIFRNLITCGAVDTNDTGIVPMRKNKNSLSASGEKTVSFSSEICKAEKLRGSQRIFGTAWNQQHQQTNERKSCDGAFSSTKNKSEFGSRRSVSANYKPINGPNCS